MAAQQTVYTHGAQHLIPAAPPAAFKTYTALAPAETHFRQALCEEIECTGYVKGWASAFDESDPEKAAQANYVRNFSDRQFTEHKGMRVPKVDGGTEIVIDDAGPLTVFKFPAGQMCFEVDSHRVPLEREPLYVVRDGDWRANPTGRVMQHANAVDFIDDIGEYMDRVADDKNKG